MIMHGFKHTDTCLDTHIQTQTAQMCVYIHMDSFFNHTHLISNGELIEELFGFIYYSDVTITGDHIQDIFLYCVRLQHQLVLFNGLSQ